MYVVHPLVYLFALCGVFRLLQSTVAERVPDNIVPTWIVGSISHSAHVALYQCFVTNRTGLDAITISTLCCQAINRCPIHVLDRTAVRNLCNASLVAIPSWLTLSLNNSKASLKIPVRSLIEELPRQRKAPPLAAQLEQDDSGSSESSDPYWTHMLWDDDLRQGVFFGEQKGHAEKFLESSVVVGDTVPTFEATLTSQLSQDGGMHRQLRHTVRVKLPSESNTDDNGYQLEAFILVYLQPSMFVNVEDAFETTDDRLDVSLILADEMTVIDEEQPTFASLPHALMIRLQGPVSSASPTNEATTIEFATKVHLRYPRPLADADFSRVVMLAPSFVGGSLTQVNNNGDGGRRYQLSPQGIDYVDMAPIMTTWVANGKELDYGPVVFVTMVAALVGTVLILRDVAKAAKKL